MNNFGQILKINIFGESHGQFIGVLIDGCPPGIEVLATDFSADLSRRKAGIPGTTARIEEDKPIVSSGVFNNKTTGAPICILFENKNTISKDYDANIMRPGRPDYPAYVKYGGFNDYRGGGPFSGRLTLALVAAGTIAKKIISPIEINCRIKSIGGSEDFDSVVAQAVESGDSVGAVLECVCSGIPVGLGEPFFYSVESALSAMMFSIPGIKGIEFGAGFQVANMRGSEFNDQFENSSGKLLTNNSGGISGGISNGEDIIFRLAARPTGSIAKTQKALDVTAGEVVDNTGRGRHDACFALRLPPVIEAVAALVLADFILMRK